MQLLIRIGIASLINAAALWVCDWLFDGVTFDDGGSLLFAAIVLGVINTLLKPVLVILSIPLIIITLGLFLLLLNIALLGLTDWIVSDFDIEGFWTYVGCVFVIWLVNTCSSSSCRRQQLPGAASRQARRLPPATTRRTPAGPRCAVEERP